VALDRDYDIVIGKVPRKDKKGNDITEDKLGAGGRHRSDGTYSGVAYDFEIINEESQLLKVTPEKSCPKFYNEFSPIEKLIIDVIEIVAVKTAEYLTDKALSSFEQWLKNRKKKGKKTVGITTRKTKAQQLLDERNRTHDSKKITSDRSNTILTLVQFNNVYKQYTINMTSEEAKKELLDIFILYIICVRKEWRLLHANIEDDSGSLIEIKVGLECLSAPDVIDSINTILAEKPALLDEWESITLSELLKRELVINHKYIPIDDKSFRECLLSI